MAKTQFRPNIMSRFIFLLILTGVVPLLVLGFTTYYGTYLILRAQAVRYYSALIFDQASYVDLLVKDISTQAEYINKASPVQDVLSAAGAGTGLQKRAQDYLDEYKSIDGLVALDLFLKDGTRYHSGEPAAEANLRGDVRERLFQQAMKSPGKTIWLGIEENLHGDSAHPKVLTAVRSLNSVNNPDQGSNPPGMLVISLDPAVLRNYFQQANLGGNTFLTLVDEQGRFLYSPDNKRLGEKTDAGVQQKTGALEGSFEERVNEQDMVAFYNRSPQTGWVTTGYIPLELLLAPLSLIRMITLIVLALSFMVVGIAGWSISKSVVRPIREITSRFKLLQSGNLGEVPHMVVTSRDEIGELITWFNTFIDSMAEKGKAEEALRESEDRYALAVRGANDGIWDWDLRTDLIYFSPRWKSMLGYSEKEIGENSSEWLARIHPEDTTQVRADLDAHLSGKKPYFESEHRIFHKNGRYHWVLARGLAVRDDRNTACRIAGSMTDITARKATEESLRHDAMHDPLTGLHNRSYFVDQLIRSIERTKRHPEYQAALLLMNLDRFRLVNDSLGHGRGDQLLIAIAQRLKASLRLGDTIGRFGGDEFVILLEDIHSVNEAKLIAGRLQEEIAQPFDLNGQDVFTTVSIGMVFITRDYDRAEDLLRDADTALHQAKANGRSRYQIFESDMHTRSLVHLQLESELRRALERSEFELYYQPIIDFQTKRVSKLEALIRWKHPTRGLIFPGDFIALAEETGLIIPMGEWILETGCNQMKEWRDLGHTDIQVSINISAHQLQERDFVETIHKILERVGLETNYLNLEITESAAMRDLDQTIRILSELSEMGVSISIDDFGISYSSLGQLNRLPVNTIKIDRSFVRRIASNEEDAAIATAIIAMGHILKLRVIAEGVETIDQFKFLASEHCDEAQGYLICRPQPVRDIYPLLLKKEGLL
jgi:diguanylate cyclase (GGDEF)-like protein/PAS domain S-box-containing protein